MFGVPKGKLLGFMVSAHGIEANVEKISTIQNMGLITNIKGVQRLTGCLASLSRFISQLGERGGMSLYKLLKKSDQFQWTEEAQTTLDKIKAFLTTPPVLVSSTAKEPILLYITATMQVMSTALVVEREEIGHTLAVQHSVYFISEVLSNSKTQYP